MGLEQFDQSIECFRKVLSQPTQVLHQVHMDAWERVTLLYLIQKGKKFDMNSAGVFRKVSREIETINAQRNINFGMMYEQEDTDNDLQMQSMGQKSWHNTIMSAWESDNVAEFDTATAQVIDHLNLERVHGLVMRLRKSLIEKKIRELNATYLTLSIPEISKITNFKQQELEPFIAKMIAEGSINARLNQKQQTVDFLEGSADTQTDSNLVNGQTLKLVNQLEKQN